MYNNGTAIISRHKSQPVIRRSKYGKMQLPEFQRNWTWDDNRIKGIIASLSQGYPRRISA